MRLHTLYKQENGELVRKSQLALPLIPAMQTFAAQLASDSSYTVGLVKARERSNEKMRVLVA